MLITSFSKSEEIVITRNGNYQFNLGSSVGAGNPCSLHNTSKGRHSSLTLCFCFPAMPVYLLSFQYLHPHHCHGDSTIMRSPSLSSSHLFLLRCEHCSAPRQTQVTSSLSHCPGVGINRFSYIKNCVSDQWGHE